MILLGDNAGHGHIGQKIHVEKYLIVIKLIKRNIYISMVPIVWIFLGVFLEKWLILNYQETFELDRIYIEEKVHLPILLDKIHFDIYASNKICQNYINDGKIEKKIYKNGVMVKLATQETFSHGDLVSYKISKQNKLTTKCTIDVDISDPYGNMFKFILLYVLPILWILYILFKQVANSISNAMHKKV